MRAATECGVSIPDELSVIGFDNIEVCDLIHPPLTTIHQPMREVGARAAGFVLDQIAGGAAPVPEAHLLPAVLVARQSVAPPPDRRRGIAGLMATR